jgi:hypothetical protein
MKKLLGLCLLFLSLASVGWCADKSSSSFGLSGGLFGSFEIWDQLADKSAGSLGYGAWGYLALGLKMDTMFIGIGPHLGGNFWSTTHDVYNGSGTMNVLDYGGDFVARFDDVDFVVGLGQADVSVSATAGYASDTETFPTPAKYLRAGFSWSFGGMAIGASYVSYSDWAKNLSRFELNLGFVF